MFLAAKFIGLALHPSVMVIGLVVIGVLFRRQRLALAGVLALLAAILLPIDDWTGRPLENRFVRPDPTHVDGIVVLGGAVDEVISADRGTPSVNGAAARLLAMADLSRRFPAAVIVFAGGTGRIDFGPVAGPGPGPVAGPGQVAGPLAEADAVRTLLPALGLSPDRVRFDRNSRTTAENATEALALAKPVAGQCWLLVTSALHMPRAMAEFQAAGFAVAPWPVGYTTRTSADEWLEPPATRLGRLDAAAHEWVGLLAASWRWWRLPQAARAPVARCNEREPA